MDHDMDLNGVISPVPTPFVGEEVDLSRFRENLEMWMSWQGPGPPGGGGPFRLSGVLVGGSNGEGPLLADREVENLVRVAREVVPRDRLLLAGVTRESTLAALNMAQRVAGLGADAVLVGAPIYFRRQMSTEDIVSHFEAVAAALPIPVILYSVPRFSGFEIPVQVVQRLSSNPRIAGLKDSGVDTSRVVEILAGDHPVKGDGFRVMAGNATVFYPALACGAAGGILAAACVVPGLACALLAAWQANDQNAARRIQKRLTPLARAVTVEHGVAGLKLTLEMIGLHGGPPRLPLRPLPEKSRAALRRVLDHALWASGEELGAGARLVDRATS
ncbi:MAG: dihydrodipicolinate synthase family protein [Acidobacteriota bacterium]